MYTPCARRKLGRINLLLKRVNLGTDIEIIIRSRNFSERYFLCGLGIPVFYDTFLHTHLSERETNVNDLALKNSGLKNLRY